jgi:hypothetical protein
MGIEKDFLEGDTEFYCLWVVWRWSIYMIISIVYKVAYYVKNA